MSYLYLTVNNNNNMDFPGWYIVKFLNENNVEVVPCNWFKIIIIDFGYPILNLKQLKLLN